MRTLRAIANADEAAFIGFEDASSLLRAILFNMLLALENGHLRPNFVHAVLSAVETNLAKAATVKGKKGAAQKALPSIAHAYQLLRAELKRRFEKLKFHREACAKHPCAHETRGVTIQSADGFAFWLKSESRAEDRDRLSATRVKYLVKKFNQGGATNPNETLGISSSVLWLTVEDAKFQRYFGPSYVPDSEEANQVRQLLGLSHCGPGTHLVSFLTRDKLTHLQSRVRVCGPTVADAPMHDRFAHWPQERDDSVVWGMTFRIDASHPRDPRRQIGTGGVVEYICEPLPLPRVGQAAFVGAVDDDREDVSDQDYANRLTSGLSLDHILSKILAKLKGAARAPKKKRR